MAARLEQRLVRLARDKSASGRGMLVEALSDIFTGTPEAPSDAESALISDILRKLLHEVEMEVRRRLAERFSLNADAPRELVIMLANDEVEIARPILVASGVLDDHDLIEVVHHRSMEHRLAIAMRKGVSEVVGDALVEHGDEDVIEALIRNGDATLSRRASEHLVAESQRIDRFREPLLRRADLPADLAHRMFWWVSAALRAHIMHRFPMEEAVLDDHLQDATAAALEGARERDGPPTDAEVLIARVARLGELDEGFLVRSLRQGHLNVFIAALAWLAKLDGVIARRVLFDPSGEVLAMTCKAIGIESAGFATIFRLSRGATRASAEDALAAIEDMLAFYDGLSEDTARAALRIWQRDRAYVAAITQVSAAATTRPSQE